MNVNGNYYDDHENGYASGIVLTPKTFMFTMEYNKLYEQIYNLSNLILAYRKARKGKTKKNYVIEFESNLFKNLIKLSALLKISN